jgi:hypothetical protein
MGLFSPYHTLLSTPNPPLVGVAKELYLHVIQQM